MSLHCHRAFVRSFSKSFSAKKFKIILVKIKTRQSGIRARDWALDRIGKVLLAPCVSGWYLGRSSKPRLEGENLSGRSKGASSSLSFSYIVCPGTYYGTDALWRSTRIAQQTESTRT